MLISIKQEHIDKQGKTPCDCPISLAGKCMPEFTGKEIAVWPGSFRVGYRNSEGLFVIEHRYNLDIMVTGWLIKYDDGGSVSPFSFDLDTLIDYARKD